MKERKVEGPEGARSLAALATRLHRDYGASKRVGKAQTTTEPHFFLHRAFGPEQDLLVILNTKRCRYACHFCQLPQKSSHKWIAGDDVVAQFRHAMLAVKHSLGVISQVTLSNEGSVLDAKTLDRAAIEEITVAVAALPRARKIVLETRLEFVDVEHLARLREAAPKLSQVVLTGFETQDERIRDEVLGKREPLAMFREGLDRVAEADAALTSYVLFKPDPSMSDADALDEARRTVDLLREECSRREIPLTIRINPMYLARGSTWEEQALHTTAYRPPRLTDVMELAAELRHDDVPVYVGLSTEELAEERGTYRAREDFLPALIGAALEFNEGGPWT